MSKKVLTGAKIGVMAKRIEQTRLPAPEGKPLFKRDKAKRYQPNKPSRSAKRNAKRRAREYAVDQIIHEMANVLPQIQTNMTALGVQATTEMFNESMLNRMRETIRAPRENRQYIEIRSPTPEEVTGARIREIRRCLDVYQDPEARAERQHLLYVDAFDLPYDLTLPVTYAKTWIRNYNSMQDRVRIERERLFQESRDRFNYYMYGSGGNLIWDEPTDEPKEPVEEIQPVNPGRRRVCVA